MAARRMSRARAAWTRHVTGQDAGEEKSQKYHNEPLIVDGVKYRSKRELKRHRELLLLERAGEIAGLQREVRFDLLPNMRRADGKPERGVFYVADFTYRDAAKGGALVVEDVKSEATKTKDYIIKRKLMLHFHGITIREVEK